jgi:hypothetical protein
MNFRNSNPHTQVLHQLKTLLNNLTQKQFSEHLDILNGSSIGQHTRHILEFYQCLQTSIQTGIVNYDKRLRSLMMENELFYAQKVVENQIQTIEQVEEDLSLILSSDEYEDVKTNFKREMIYLTEHTVHHLAIIRIALENAFPQTQFDKHLGIAFSTHNHRNQHVACHFTRPPL